MVRGGMTPIPHRSQSLFLMSVASLAVASCGVGSGHTQSPRPFDAQMWRAAAGDDRCDMVDDLRDRAGLQNRSRAEISALLGEPETHDDASDHYHLCPSLMDVWVLEIEWENGRVASTRVRDT